MKSKILFAIVMVCFLGSSLTCYAAQSTLNTKTAVDSNTWTYLTSAVKDSTGTVATVYISEIYDANGNNSNYQKVKIAVNGSGSSYAYNEAVQKYESEDIDLLEENQKKGTTLYFYGMGNDPALDCMITGSFSAN